MPPRRTPLQRHLDREFGPNGEGLIDVLKKIALGELTTEAPSGLDGLTKIVRPTVAERTVAAKALLAYQHGMPHSTIDVQVDVEPKKKWNPDALSLAELEQLDRLARKANAPALASGIVIDGEFTACEPARDGEE